MLYKNLLHRTGVQLSSISVVEAHGTGTQAGDTREIASLETVFGKYHSESHPLMVSSIKGNIGHCGAASGAAGLAKVLLMLRHDIMPKQASLTNLNPRITELQEGHLKIPQENQPWPATKYIPDELCLTTSVLRDQMPLSFWKSTRKHKALNGTTYLALLIRFASQLRPKMHSMSALRHIKDFLAARGISALKTSVT